MRQLWDYYDYLPGLLRGTRHLQARPRVPAALALVSAATAVLDTRRVLLAVDDKRLASLATILRAVLQE